MDQTFCNKLSILCSMSNQNLKILRPPLTRIRQQEISVYRNHPMFLRQNSLHHHYYKIPILKKKKTINFIGLG